MNYNFKNLVFEGGGVKGIAYVGAIEVLEEMKILDTIDRIGGTSAGAITAILVGLNYSTEEIKKILYSIDFNNFMDDSWGMIQDTNRLISEFGWHKGDFFRKWIASLIGKKTGKAESTFANINSLKDKKGFKDLYLVGTNLSTRFSEIFSFEHTPEMCVADAARISMSLPLFFAVKRSLRGDIYVDGSVLNNYPIKLFDRKKYLTSKGIKTVYYERHNQNLKKQNKRISPYIFNEETLGFRLDSATEIACFRDQSEPERQKITNIFSYCRALITTIMDIQEKVHLHSDDWKRTVYIDTLGVKTTEFTLTDTVKQKLIESGRQGVKKYFMWYNVYAS